MAENVSEIDIKWILEESPQSSHTYCIERLLKWLNNPIYSHIHIILPKGLPDTTEERCNQTGLSNDNDDNNNTTDHTTDHTTTNNNNNNNNTANKEHRLATGHSFKMDSQAQFSRRLNTYLRQAYIKRNENYDKYIAENTQYNTTTINNKAINNKAFQRARCESVPEGEKKGGEDNDNKGEGKKHRTRAQVSMSTG
jgi:hypothetical protein